jgi:hypothetical protein
MSRDRRKNLIRKFERVAVGLVALDAVLYFVVLKPLRTRAQSEFESINEVRLSLRNEEARVKRLEWYKNALPATESDLDDFMSNEVQSKQKVYSRSTRLVRGLAQEAGLELALNGISSRMDPSRAAPLGRMNLMISVNGPFKSLLSFAHALETTSDDFLIIRDFRFDSGEGEDMSLRLSADLYLTQ